MNTKTSQGSAMFLIILVVVILGVVIISFVKIPNFPSFLKPAPTSEPIKRDQSLEDYLKNKFGLCVEYLGENTCTPQNTKTAPPGNINSGEPLVISIQVVSGDFALINLTSGPAVVQKQNGSWSIIY